MIRNYIQAFTCVDKAGFKRYIALKPGTTSPDRGSKRYQDNYRDMKELLNNSGMTKKLGIDLKKFDASSIKKLNIKHELIDFFDTPDVLNTKPENAIFRRIPEDLFLKTEGQWKEFCKNDTLVLDAFKSVKIGMLKFESTFKEFEVFISGTTCVQLTKDITDASVETIEVVENIILPIADIFNLSLNKEKTKVTISLIGYDNLKLKPDQREWSFTLTTKGRVRFQIGGKVARDVFKSNDKYRIDLDCFNHNPRHVALVTEIKQLRNPNTTDTSNKE